LLSAKRCEFGEVKYQRRVVDCYDFHSHDVFVISATDGCEKLMFEFENDKVEMGRDTVVCFAPRKRHKAVVEHEATDYLIMHIETSWLRKKLGIDLDAIAVRSHVVSRKLHRKFVAIVYELLDGDSGCDDKVRDWLLELFDNIYYNADVLIEGGDMEQIRRYIQTNWNIPITLEHLSEKFGLNSYALMKHFKNSFGSTPKKYQTDIRVHKAKNLIADGMDISEAALECGFYDQSHLYNYFQKIFGVSPKTYQKAFD
jgi:AraC-like DNA-binding protein